MWISQLLFALIFAISYLPGACSLLYCTVCYPGGEATCRIVGGCVACETVLVRARNISWVTRGCSVAFCAPGDDGISAKTCCFDNNCNALTLDDASPDFGLRCYHCEQSQSVDGASIDTCVTSASGSQPTRQGCVACQTTTTNSGGVSTTWRSCVTSVCVASSSGDTSTTCCDQDDCNGPSVLKCYSCHGSTQSRNSVDASDCHVVGTSTPTAYGCTTCQKTTIEALGFKTVTRFCANDCVEDISGLHDVTSRTTCCNTTLCNGAPWRLPNSNTYIIVLVIVMISWKV